jgi:hypothetical protein
MERVAGIGGYFMRAADQAALGAWYRDYLGLDADEKGLWHQEPGLTVLQRSTPRPTTSGPETSKP